MKETLMEQETFNLSIRKYLKTVGIRSQREIEEAVSKAITSGAIAGVETLAATITLKIPALRLAVKFDGQIELK
jgi:hypothetical protein